MSCTTRPNKVLLALLGRKITRSWASRRAVGGQRKNGNKGKLTVVGVALISLMKEEVKGGEDETAGRR